jgi:Phosphate-induced protein 1 conserved region
MQYCAYHGFIGTSPPIIYANMPFGNLSACQNPNQPSPNGNAVADAVTDVATHEITEAITDPLLNAWFDNSSGMEIGDICNFIYGANGWDAGAANQMWNGNFYELQHMSDNHVGGGVQLVI